MAFNPTYQNLAPITQALAVRRANAVSPLDSLLQGGQQGIKLANLPQTMQDQELARQLTNAINLQKLQELQNPEQALARKIQQELVIKGALNPDLGISATPAGLTGQTIATPQAIGQTEQSLEALLSQNPSAAIPSAAPKLPITPVAAGNVQTGLSVDPNIPLEAAQRKNDLMIARARAAMKGTTTKEGYFQDPSTGELTQIFLPGASGDLASERKTAEQSKEQAKTDAIQAKIAAAENLLGRKLTAQEEAQAKNLEVKTSEGDKNRDLKTTLDEKRASKGDAKIVEGLARAVQSNKSYQAYRTITDALKGLEDTLDYAKSNPLDQTGIKSSAVDAFNRIINPNSIVRQQSFAQTTTGQSLINKINTFAQGIISGQTITPEQIQSMINIANTYEEGARDSVERELAVIKHRGDKAGISTDEYLPELFKRERKNNAGNVNPSSGMTRIVTPTGQELDIPSNNLGEALKRGAKLK